MCHMTSKQNDWSNSFGQKIIKKIELVKLCAIRLCRGSYLWSFYEIHNLILKWKDWHTHMIQPVDVPSECVGIWLAIILLLIIPQYKKEWWNSGAVLKYLFFHILVPHVETLLTTKLSCLSKLTNKKNITNIKPFSNKYIKLIP